MDDIRKIGAAVVVAAALLVPGGAVAQDRFGDTVMFERAPTLEELNALFAGQKTEQRKRAVRRINIGAPPPTPAPSTTGASMGGGHAEQARSDGSAPRKLAIKIEFELNSAEIDPAYTAHLDTVAQFLSENPDKVVTVAGHADATGDAAHNADLSKRRAMASYLTMGYGLDDRRVKAAGYGESQPLPGLSSTDPRNRRVEFAFR